MRRKGYRIIEEDVILSANIFYRGKVPGDLDHIVATLLDGIKGVVMRDDKLVKGFERVFAIPNFGQDCVVIELRPIKDLTK